MSNDIKTIASRLTELPDVIQDYLYDPEASESFELILESHNLKFEQERKLLHLISRVFVKDVELFDIASVLQEELSLDEGASKLLAKDLAGHKFLIFNGYLGDVDGFIRTLGGNPDDYPKERIKVEERTTEAAVKDVEGVVEVGQLPHRLKSRFENVLRSYFKGVRTESQLIDILTREEKVGGVGLEISVAKTVVAEAQEERRSVIIQDKKVEKTAQKTATNEPKTHKTIESVLSEKLPEPEKPKSTFVTVLPEDEEEIEQLKKKMPKSELDKSADTSQKIKASVEEIYKAAGVGLGSSEALQARFKKIIENRLRDIRDQLETLQILVQPKELGGLSLSQDDARRIISLIEGKLKGVHEKHQEVVKENKAAWVAGEARKSLERKEVSELAEKTSRDTAFAQATLRSKKLSKEPVLVTAKPAPPTNLPIPPGNAAAPVPATLPRPAPRPLGATKPMLPKKIASSEMKMSSVSKQSPSSPVRTLSAASSPAPSAVTMKPVMKDVQSVTPLATGPVQALRTTSLVDFRRLSKIPKEATLKLKDKIDLLGEDSFRERSAGIVAWGESGVFKLYLAMMGEALEGKSMDEVISNRLAEKKDVLTKEEIQAIVQLGISLRA